MHLLECMDIAITEEARQSVEMQTDSIKYFDIIALMSGEQSNGIWKLSFDP